LPGFDFNATGHAGEAAADLPDHEVADDELDRRVRGIDGVNGLLECLGAHFVSLPLVSGAEALLVVTP
jgi:hypothetical protein